jgi:glycosyltransferase 2 family protein
MGGVLLLFTVQRVGWADVQSSLSRIGWWFIAVLALGGFRFAARTHAWLLCVETQTLPFGRAFAAILAGDALGNLTPLGVLASEPAKVLFVNDRVPTMTAVASIAAENAFYMATVLLMIGAGAIVFFGVAELSPTLSLAAQAVIGAVMAGFIVALWIARRQPAILSRLAHVLTTWTGRGATAPDRLRELERRFYAVLTWPGARVARVLGSEAAFHVAAVAEVFMVLRLLPRGPEITLLDAFVLETAGRLIVVAFKFVPYRLGVDEAGTALVARALAMDPAVGVTLAFVRRLRILVWNAVGLILLAARR